MEMPKAHKSRVRRLSFCTSSGFSRSPTITTGSLHELRSASESSEGADNVGTLEIICNKCPRIGRQFFSLLVGALLSISAVC